jgi:hypothetical protein
VADAFILRRKISLLTIFTLMINLNEEILKPCYSYENRLLPECTDAGLSIVVSRMENHGCGDFQDLSYKLKVSVDLLLWQCLTFVRQDNLRRNRGRS